MSQEALHQLISMQTLAYSIILDVLLLRNIDVHLYRFDSDTGVVVLLNFASLPHNIKLQFLAFIQTLDKSFHGRRPLE